jgi:hypothetical protein
MIIIIFIAILQVENEMGGWWVGPGTGFFGVGWGWKSCGNG